MSKLNENTLAEQLLIDWLKKLTCDHGFRQDLVPRAKQKIEEMIERARI